MANPAELLHAQLVSWNHPQASAEQVRGVSGGDWSGQRLAVRHLEAVEQILDELARTGRPVELARAYFPSWTAAVFSHPGGWRPQSSANLDRQALDQLRGLADRLSDLMPTADQVKLGQLVGFLDDLDGVLADSSAPVDLRAHLANVAAHVRWCITNYEIVGDFELASALEQLWGTVGRVATNDKEENQSRWTNVMTKFGWPFGAGYLANIAAPGTQALIQLATGG